MELLVRSAARGDEQAWQALVTEFAPRVFALIRSRCGDPDLAEEITQSVFASVAEKLCTYQDHGRFRSWLFQVAMNRLRDELRRRGRHAKAVGGVDEVDAAGDFAVRCGYQTDNSAAIDQLEVALSRLSEPEQRLIHLRHVAGLGFREIAELTGEPLGTLLARHHRALARIRSILEDAGIDGKDMQ